MATPGGLPPDDAPIAAQGILAEKSRQISRKTASSGQKWHKKRKMDAFWAFGAKNGPIFGVFGAKTAFAGEFCNIMLQKQLELKIRPFVAKNSKNREKGLLEGPSMVKKSLKMALLRMSGVN